MSFVIEQKIKGNIYLYKVENQWDKVKKKTFQKRTYLGPKFPKKEAKSRTVQPELVNKNYGNIFLLEFLCKKIGLEALLKNCFPDCSRELMALAFYEASEGDPFYLFPYWQEENHLPDVKNLDSPGISNLLELIGKNEKQRHSFFEKWTAHLQPLKALYFDISSISSYANKVNFIEWGYNRDKESLPQVNIGMVFCEEKKLPVYYNLYGGSIVDVTTLKNCKKYLNSFGLKDFLFVLDRGFFSTANISEMNALPDKIYFIQPLSFRVKNARALILKHRQQLKTLNTAFPYNQEIIHHIKSKIKFGNDEFDAHLFYNEKLEVEVRHHLLLHLFGLEKKLGDNTFDTLKQWRSYRDDHIAAMYRDFFNWNKTTKKVERNIRNINAHLSTSAFYIMATNKLDMDAETVLTHYRNRDLVEKVFDVLKNEMDGKRLRTHNDYTTAGKMFLLFVALILHSEILRVMNANQLFKIYTVKELLLELKKIKINQIQSDGKPMVGEISKKQRTIFKHFEISINQLHGY